MAELVRVMLTRIWTEERGDQNVGSLGLIVVAVAIIGILTTTLVPGVQDIVSQVICQLKGSLNMTC